MIQAGKDKQTLNDTDRHGKDTKRQINRDLSSCDGQTNIKWYIKIQPDREKQRYIKIQPDREIETCPEVTSRSCKTLLQSKL